MTGISWTQNGKLLKAKGEIAFQSHVFNIILMAPNFVFSTVAHNVYADVAASELSTGNGYTSGGATLSGVLVARADSIDAIQITWNNQTWNAAGGSLSTQGIIIIDTSVSGSPIIAEGDAGATITAINGTPLIAGNLMLQEQ